MSPKIISKTKMVKIVKHPQSRFYACILQSMQHKHPVFTKRQIRRNVKAHLEIAARRGRRRLGCRWKRVRKVILKVARFAIILKTILMGVKERLYAPGGKFVSDRMKYHLCQQFHQTKYFKFAA